VLVRATPAGEQLMHQARHARLETIARALGTLDADAQGAISAAAPHLRRLAAAVSSEADADRP
jgi:hypothetical protein